MRIENSRTGATVTTDVPVALNNVVTADLTASGQATPAFIPAKQFFNMSIYGTFVGTVVLERSFDKGTTWIPITALGTAVSYTGVCSEIQEEPEQGVYYRVRCTAYTSGTIKVRLSY